MRAVKHALIVLPVLLVAACSGGSSAQPGSGRSAFIAKAEVICAKANKAKDGLKKPLSTTDLATYVHSLVMVADESTTALLELTPPADDKKDLEAQVLEPLSKQLVKARAFDAAIAKAVKANDQVTIVNLLKDPPTKTTANLDYMRKYGFKECVTAADTSS
ncbi:MAG: hypothetical protein JWO22_1090 [Frankiales bacterium]|nr:hypothetical protein [Frankiales bacterium]